MNTIQTLTVRINTLCDLADAMEAIGSNVDVLDAKIVVLHRAKKKLVYFTKIAVRV